MTANLAAIALLHQLRDEQRPATVDELPALAAWSSWGAVPALFDNDRPEWAAEREQLRGLLTDREWAAASRTTINAHYTDPHIVAEMWSLASRLGLSEGQVLEPGCGSGTFIGLAPETVTMTGIELDPTTAAIAAALYPNATIRCESFADTRMAAGRFDGAIGNVPFSSVSLHDPVHNRHAHSMHNHFLLKAVDLVRPGGAVIALTSSFTLDATNPAVRRELYATADLLGAIRLPTGAHRRTAGTEALTDLLVLRRRLTGEQPGDDTWLLTYPQQIDGAEVRINRYLLNHPSLVLGRWTVGHGMYGAETLQVRGDLGALPDTLHTATEQIAQTAFGAGLTVTPRAEGTAPAAVAGAPDLDRAVGTVTGSPAGGFVRQTVDGPEPLPVPASQRRELSALLRMRDLAHRLLQMEAASLDDGPDLATQRSHLADTYTTYLREYGPINRYTAIQTRRIDPDTGEPAQQRRRPPVMRWIRTDPLASLIRALEVFDDTTQSSTPAALLSERVVVPRTPPLGVDTPDEAITVAMETDGKITLARISQLLGVDPPDARNMLGELVYDDPATDRLVPRAEYLSGNVRVKLDQAQTALFAGDERMTINVAALQQVLPTPLGPTEIAPRIGAVWIDAADYEQFLRELTGDGRAKVAWGGGTAWEVTAERWSVASTSEWGTDRRSAGDLVEALLCQRPISVYDTDSQTQARIFNAIATEAAKEKADAIQDRFAEWIWEDPQRADRLTVEYNRRFNSLVLRDYGAEGERLTLPGLAATMTPRPHQLSAVARMISEPAVLLAHEVGAGKTGEMVCGAMELRRLGMVSKPAVVVPNHMLEQFSREWVQWYPRAKVLAASSDDLAAENRRDFVARVATGDWDGVVMTRSAFQRLSVSTDAEADYTGRELASLREQIELAKANGASRTVKQVEKMLLRREEDVKGKLDQSRDPGLSFEDTGIDYLIVDEAHQYKNLSTVSSIPGAAIAGSQRASDLHMKLELLRHRHGERVTTFATATPIANSITEAHVMTRYLRPDLLADAGVLPFDAWAATFAETITELELTVTGGYREKTRFARFQNVPEMLRTWHVFTDVKTAEDLNLPTPALAIRPDGQRGPETVIIPPSPELLAFMAELASRAENLSGRSDPGEDNMLRITGEGRRAALDMRLVGSGIPTVPQKLDVAAERIARIWRDNQDRTYTDDTGQAAPTSGALQLVFCDQSTPKADRWNAYSELKSQLIQRGLLPRSIRFIHDAASDTDKARLFASCRAGEVAVLLGSTEKMGVGVNVQARAIALHHLDCPWRPADLAQRDGRIVRQGNQNPEVAILRYTTGRSFDSYSWQTVERKAIFSNQLLRGRLDVREIEDIGDTALSLAETKALAADDPLILEKATLDARMNKLARLDRAHHQQQSMLAWRARNHREAIDRADVDEPLLVAAVARTVDTAGEKFQARVDGRPYTERSAAAVALRDSLAGQLGSLWQRRNRLCEVDLGGHRFALRAVEASSGWRFEVSVADTPRAGFTLGADSVREGLGAIRSLEYHAGHLSDLVDQLRGQREDDRRQEIASQQALGRPFKHTEELRQLRQRAEDLQRRMAERAHPQRAQPPTAPPPSLDPDVAQAVHLAQQALPTSSHRIPAPHDRGASGRPPGPPPATHDQAGGRCP